MTACTVRIGRDRRPWASGEWRQFVGTYEREGDGCLLFCPSTPEAHRQEISAAFAEIPAPMREVALLLGLTVSTTTASLTRAGNLSTVYARWNAPWQEMAPHIEMTTTSLSPSLLAPHLTHEIFHLFLQMQDAQSRAACARAMIDLASGGLREVTDYAQGKFDTWHDTIESAAPEHAAAESRALREWLAESLCESAGKLRDCRYGRQDADVKKLLEVRRQIMDRCFQLKF
jgi:hypothetical protein